MALWRLASPDGQVAVELAADDVISLSGTIVFQGASYAVTGGWDASGSPVPGGGRHFSAFAFSGRGPSPPQQPFVSSWLSASGIMTGPGPAPVNIAIQVQVSFSNGTSRTANETLYPS